MGRSALDEDLLRRRAESDTGLGDWGQGFHEEGLSRLLAAGREGSGLSLVSQLALSAAVAAALRNWLHLVAARRESPAHLTVPLQRPMIIMSMPRAGTTLLHHLLARHPDARFLPMWLGSCPLPPPSRAVWQAGGPVAQRRRTERTVAALYAVSPAIATIHPYGADLPTECSHLLTPTFQSNQWAAWPVNAFLEWMVDQPPPDYAHYRDPLLLLQAALPGTGWALKSPGHFVHPRAIYEAVPEALFIHIHRDPARVFPSLNSMMACHHMMEAPVLDFQRTSNLLQRAYRGGTDRFLALRRDVGQRRFIDVAYLRLKSDPLGVAREVIEAAGLRWDDEVSESLEAELTRAAAARARAPTRRHRYPLEQYGLSPALLRDRYADYIEAFDIAAETGP